ncbi:MAG: hypothetical protein ACI9F1_001989 [Colwellia sp.]|jgi:hypothetical protein
MKKGAKLKSVTAKKNTTTKYNAHSYLLLANLQPSREYVNSGSGKLLYEHCYHVTTGLCCYKLSN